MCAERRLVNFPPAVYKVGRKHGVEIGIGKMDLRKNTFRKATVAGILLCFLSTLITGCMISKQEAIEQKKWVEQMNEAFTDDHFKYQGAGFDILGGQAANEARVKSEKYPNEEIFVWGPSDDLTSNYNSIRYQKESEDYFRDYFTSKFVCDDCKVRDNSLRRASPVKDMSAEEYVQNYLQMKYVDIIIYRKSGVFPDSEVMTEKIIDICKDRDEICEFNIYCCKDKTSFENAENTCECYYHLSMHEKGKIDTLRYESKEQSGTVFLLREYTW